VTPRVGESPKPLSPAVLAAQSVNVIAAALEALVPPMRYVFPENDFQVIRVSFDRKPGQHVLAFWPAYHRLPSGHLPSNR
jgi:hypothetical protein